MRTFYSRATILWSVVFQWTTAYKNAALAGIIKFLVSSHWNGEESALERHRSGVPFDKAQNKIVAVKKHNLWILVNTERRSTIPALSGAIYFFFFFSFPLMSLFSFSLTWLSDCARIQYKCKCWIKFSQSLQCIFYC